MTIWVNLFEKKERKSKECEHQIDFLILSIALKVHVFARSIADSRSLKERKKKEMEAVHVKAIGLNPIHSIDPVS